MCEVIRAPFCPSGSLAIWTMISCPGLSRSEMEGYDRSGRSTALSSMPSRCISVRTSGAIVVPPLPDSPCCCEPKRLPPRRRRIRRETRCMERLEGSRTVAVCAEVSGASGSCEPEASASVSTASSEVISSSKGSSTPVKPSWIARTSYVSSAIGSDEGSPESLGSGSVIRTGGFSSAGSPLEAGSTSGSVSSVSS